MRGEGRLGLFIIALAIAPALVKRSKTLSKYFGDQFTKLGEYFKEGTDDAETPAAPPAAASTAEAPVKSGKPPKVTEAPAAAKAAAPKAAAKPAAAKARPARKRPSRAKTARPATPPEASSTEAAGE